MKGTEETSVHVLSLFLTVVICGLLGLVFASQAEGRSPSRRRVSLTPWQRRYKKLRKSLVPLSVKTVKRVRVWRRPGHKSMGEVTRGTYLPYMRSLKGSKRFCPKGRWHQVGSHRYLCADYGVLSYRFPHGRVQPQVKDGQLIPIPVYFARRDGVPVYKTVEDARAGKLDRVVERGFAFAARYTKRIGGKRFLVTWTRDYVPRKEMWKHRPSDFSGVRLIGRPKKPWACVIKRPGVWAYEKPGRRRRKRVSKVRYHTWVQIHEERRVRRRKYYRIGPKKWIRARAVRRIRFSKKPPKELRSPDGPWVEVLTGEQTLVAYKGSRPVYASIVSTGKYSDPTPPGVFRVWIKIACEAMSNRPGAADQYKVEAVPWILYFHKAFAIHGAYWHDGFGRPRSHGCVNLAPKDAKFVFEHSLPRLPAGWRSRWADKRSPGMLVRVRKNLSQKVEMQPLTRKKH